MSSLTLIEKHLQNSWSARFAGKLESAHQELLLAQDLMKFSKDVSLNAAYDSALNSASLPYSLVNSWLALHSWVLRMRGAVDEAEELVNHAYRKTISLGHPSDFYLEFQRGTLAHRRADYSKALDHYLLARNYAAGFEQVAVTLGNTLYALEALGLPYELTLKEFHRLLLKKPATDLQIKMYYEQLEVFQNRQWICQGEFEKVFAQSKRSEFTSPDLQPYWQNLHLSQFSYHSHYEREMPSETLATLTGSPPEHAFCARTLLGISTREEMEKIRIHHLADRIYLWTWRWLCNPNSPPLSELKKCIELFFKLANEITLSSEDFHQMRLAFRWIELFTGIPAAELTGALESFKPYPLKTIAWYDYEGQCLDYLIVKVKGNREELLKLQEQLLAHPLSKREDHFLKDLFSGTESAQAKNPEWHAFLGRLENLRAPEFSDPQNIRVDPVRGCIQYFSEGEKKVLLSASAAKALALLSRISVVSCEEFCSHALGFKRYDSQIHLPRIFNLLARLRTLLPADLKLGVKEGKVYARGSWTGVEIQSRLTAASSEVRSPGPPSLSLLPESTRRAKKITYQERDLFRQVKLAGSAVQSEFKRQELELILSLSRASVTRLLENWEKKGWVKKLGYSRNIRYQFAKEDVA